MGWVPFPERADAINWGFPKQNDGVVEHQNMSSQVFPLKMMVFMKFIIPRKGFFLRNDIWNDNHGMLRPSDAVIFTAGLSKALGQL